MNRLTGKLSAAVALFAGLGIAAPCQAQIGGKVITKAPNSDIMKSPTAPATKKTPGGVIKYDQKKIDTAIVTIERLRGMNIVEYATKRMNQKIGRGECTDLVSAALESAGAKPGNFADPKNYIWGRLLGSQDAMRPGDIIQFEDCRFETRTSTSYSYSTMPHHTAIVKSANGKVVTLLHQNAPIGAGVREQVLDLNTKTTGVFKVYRSLPK